ncbi:MarR family winged helix-turn-helix transcriptional regulator [Amycolatopsis tolypomycina]|uniref:DNA-binding transcriptional regulator, MarR family n=1 Tax=Amycolatopsis tolypomycina TaxID=208445 RepID=A0A1H4TZY0_9PSEU|nr:MarR family winged helix-turn-helix transcriptional regulator [Amycolatopsis tolypomycina]SEC61987.1 DNA-binding transcriptional regulator, MarR family [Amycolatopsis tolypomycina]
MPRPQPSDPYADLADLVLNVARLIRLRTPAEPAVVPLTATERQVMRIVDLDPGCAPSRIAERAGLQRTNVSTALRGLEAKGMLTRTGHGRSVTVHPTELAQANLGVLRGAWSALLADLLGDVDPATIARCNETLAHLERRFAGDE